MCSVVIAVGRICECCVVVVVVIVYYVVDVAGIACYIHIVLLSFVLSMVLAMLLLFR